MKNTISLLPDSQELLLIAGTIGAGLALGLFVLFLFKFSKPLGLSKIYARFL